MKESTESKVTPRPRACSARQTERFLRDMGSMQGVARLDGKTMSSILAMFGILPQNVEVPFSHDNLVAYGLWEHCVG